MSEECNMTHPTTTVFNHIGNAVATLLKWYVYYVCVILYILHVGTIGRDQRSEKHL